MPTICSNFSSWYLQIACFDGCKMIDIISFVSQIQISISIIICSLTWTGTSLLPLNLHIRSVKLTVPPSNLQYMGQSKQGLSVGWEAERSSRSLAGQQGHIQQQHHQHFAKSCTPRRGTQLSWRVCCSHPLPLTQTICACQLPVFPCSPTWWSPMPSSGSMRD